MQPLRLSQAGKGPPYVSFPCKRERMSFLRKQESRLPRAAPVWFPLCSRVIPAQAGIQQK